MGDLIPFPAARAGGRICVDCGEQIDPKRLRVISTARRCTACEMERAKRVAREAGPFGDHVPVIIQD